MNLNSEAKVIIGIVTVTFLILASAIFFLNKATPQSSTALAKKVDSKQLVKSDSQKIVVPNSKVTIVEFLDYECEACGAAHPIVKKILKEYKGKISYVVRNFPNHSNSELAANAAEAAGEQGKFWEMHNKLFETQKEWGEKQESQIETFRAYAKELGLNMEKFNATVENNKYSKKIKQDKDEGIAIGVNATPTFYINGTQYVGVLSYDQFKEILDEKLKN